MPANHWDYFIRCLHWIITVAVLFQQATSLYMSDPGTQFLFPYHQWVGLLASATVVVFWAHSYGRYDLPILFPWGKAGRTAVMEDLRGLLRARLPGSGCRPGLSGFVHGLGLLALTGCALTGTIISSMITPGQPPDDPIAFTRYTLQHKFFGTLLWVYLAGHVGFALLHQVSGNNVFRAIFSLQKDIES